ncbi:MAG: LCP family protein, partial [Anaerolineales bacterium]
EIPGFGHGKINNAYALGEGNRLPGGGAGLAVKTVEQFLGITINYYAQIDFSAFEQFVDFIGGIKIRIDQDVEIQIIGEEGTRVLQKQPAAVVLNGAYTLAYARSRHSPQHVVDAEGDFDRARRQQQVILAIRQQLDRDDVRAKLLNNVLAIYESLAGGINTNMPLDEALSLGWAVKDIDLGNIEQAVIAPNACGSPACQGDDYVTLQTSPEGLSILKPISENIRILRDEIFSSDSVQSPLAVSSQTIDLMKMEAAQVAVYNGSEISGLADSTTAYLKAQGIIIAASGNEDIVGATEIYDYTGNPYTLKYLAELMGINSARIFSRYDPNSTVDVVIILGPEWSVPAQ